MAIGIRTRAAALAFALLWLSRPATAQEHLPGAQSHGPTSGAKAAETTPESAPPPAVEAEMAEAESHGGESHKFFAVADFLLLQPRRSTLDFAIIDPNRDGFPQGSIESVNWNADSGVRIGGGFKLPEHWEVGAYYTYFWAGNSRTLAAPTGGTLYATLTQPGVVDAVDTAYASSSLRYQLVDIEFGRRIEAGESTSIWIGGGGRFAWIDQRLHAVYNGQSAFLSTVDSPISFDGGGLRMGAEGEWKVYHGIGFYGRAFGSLLAGDFRTQFVESTNNGAAVLANVTDRFHKVVPVAELGLGLYWQQSNWRAKVGYEITNWFGMVDSPDFVHDFANKLSYRTSDLSLDGLRVGLQFDY